MYTATIVLVVIPTRRSSVAEEAKESKSGDIRPLKRRQIRPLAIAQVLTILGLTAISWYITHVPNFSFNALS
jgi:hypothetical protein